MAKGQYQPLKNQKHNAINNKREVGDNRDEKKSGECNSTKEFDAISKDTRNNVWVDKPLNIKTYGYNINLCPTIIELPNSEKIMVKKNYGFDKAFNIFDEIDNKQNSLGLTRILIKNAFLECLKIIENKLSDMFCTPTIATKVNDVIVDERTRITTKLIFSCHWKNLVPFCLQNKKPENVFLTLTVNYREIE